MELQVIQYCVRLSGQQGESRRRRARVGRGRVDLNATYYFSKVDKKVETGAQPERVLIN